jgi:threonine dehydrogenase-like Zn-dependent dehydrogenase
VRALTIHGREDIHYEQVADPSIEDPGDAIVQVELAAICGSDLHVFHGREGDIDPGTIMGHEFTGRVVAGGAAVRGFRKGDRVVSPFSNNCGRCFFCRRGLTARCVHGHLFGWRQNGAGLEGAQAEYVRVPMADATLLPVPSDLTPEAALLIADVLPTGMHAARMAEVAADGTYVVLGCGPVGLLAVLSAREIGAARVFAVDGVAERLELAESYGATPLRLGEGDVVGMVRDATEGRGADAVLEAVGSEAASRLAFDLVRPGGVISMVGVHHEARFPFSSIEAYDKNLTLRIGRCPARALMEDLVPLARRCPEIMRVITHRWKLARGPEAYRLFDRKQDGCIKLTLTP